MIVPTKIALKYTLIGLIAYQVVIILIAFYQKTGVLAPERLAAAIFIAVLFAAVRAAYRAGQQHPESTEAEG